MEASMKRCSLSVRVLVKPDPVATTADCPLITDDTPKSRRSADCRSRFGAAEAGTAREEGLNNGIS
jgi:hypothetical protein